MNNEENNDQKISHLIFNTEPIEDFNDFMNQSLSEGGAFPLDIFKQKKENCDSQTHKQITINSDIQSHSQSPDAKNLVTAGNYTSSSTKKGKVHFYQPVSKKPPKTTEFSLMQFLHMKKFINRISWKKKINSIFNFYHFKVINDKAAAFNLKLFRDNSLRLKPMIATENMPKPDEESLFKKLLTKTKRTAVEIYQRIDRKMSQVPLFYPETRAKIIWDCLVLLARLYFMFSIPLDISFSEEQILYEKWLTITFIMVIVMFVDLIISFNTAYYQQGQVVTKRWRIAGYVVSKGFGLEIISIFMLIFTLAFSQANSDYRIGIQHNWYQLFMLVFFVQFKNIQKLIRQVEEALNLSKPSSSLLELMKLIASVIYVIHVFACLWFWAGYYSHIKWNASWLDAKELVGRSWDIHYLYSFYYSTVTMFTVGYGDISPVSDLEMLISIGFMMICSIQLSYSVSTVGAIIDKIFAYEDEKMKKVQTINSYMQSKKISYQLQYQYCYTYLYIFFRIREYLNYFWNSQNEEDNFEEQQIIEQLSESLKEKLKVEANSLILNTCPLFRDCFSKSLKQRLVKKIQSVLIQPENIINFDNLLPEKQGQSFLCFIEKGSVQIFIENEDVIASATSNSEVSIVSTLQQGASIGITSFLTGKKTAERYKSVGFTKLLVVARDDFIKILQDYPEDYEQFKNLYDKLIFNQSISFLDMKCFSCNSSSHKALECPLLHFIPDRERIIKKNQFSRPQFRNEGGNNIRGTREKDFFQTFGDKQMIKEAAQCFQNENWKWLSLYEIEEEPQGQNQEEFSQQKKQKEEVVEQEELQQPQQQQQKRKSMALTRQKTRNVEDILGDKKKKNVSFMSEQPIDLQQVARKSIKQKFKNVVFMIKNMNQMNTKKPFSKQLSKVFLENSYLEQEQKERQQRLQKNITILEQRLKQIQVNHGRISKHDHDKMQMECLKLKMLCHHQQYIANNFDHLKIFKFYQTHNNLDEILKKQYEYYMPQLKLVPELPDYYQHFSKYLLYPYAFIEKYKYVEVELLKEEIKQQDEIFIQKDSPSENEEPIMFPPPHQRNRKPSMRNIKKSQIRPQSDGAILYQK